MKKKLWRFDDFKFWEQQGLLDHEKGFSCLFASFKDFSGLPERIAIIESIATIIEQRLRMINGVINKDKDSLLALRACIDRGMILFKDFTVLSRYYQSTPFPEKMLIKPPKKVNSTPSLPVKNIPVDIERKRILYVKEIGFVHCRTLDKPSWHIELDIVDTFKEGTNIHDVNKLIFLKDGSLYLILPSEDELIYTENEPILFCGEVRIVDGRMTYINNLSAVYPMKEEQLIVVIEQLKMMGVTIEDIKVEKLVLSEEAATKIRLKKREEFKKWETLTPNRTEKRYSLYPTDPINSLMFEPVVPVLTKQKSCPNMRKGSSGQLTPLRKKNSIERVAARFQPTSLDRNEKKIKMEPDRICVFMMAMMMWLNTFDKPTIREEFFNILRDQKDKLLSEDDYERQSAQEQFKNIFSASLKSFLKNYTMTEKQREEIEEILLNAPWIVIDPALTLEK